VSKDPTTNDAGHRLPFAAESVPWETFSHGERFAIRYRQLGEHGGGSHVGVCMEELAPGKQAYPAHYHMLEEEHLLVLSGTLTLLLDGERYPMRAGDYVCFPAGQRAGHAIVNESDEACRYLIVGERNPNDVIVYPDSGRVGVRLLGEGYRESATMDYWEGYED
jgi:uncharacterized cupin superfamily protein